MKNFNNFEQGEVVNIIEPRSASTWKSLFIFSALILSLASLGFGQNSRDVNVVNTPDVKVVNIPTVGIDPTKNTVKVATTQSDPLAVKVVGGAVRRPFQAGVNLDSPAGANAGFARLTIPSGKRLVIENVSAVTFGPQGQGMLINFQTAMQDIVGDTDAGGPFENHDLVLTSQGIFNGLERRTASQKVLVFADESIQTSNGPAGGIDVTVNLSRGGSNGSAGARVTFSGYVEDLPAATQQ